MWDSDPVRKIFKSRIRSKKGPDPPRCRLFLAGRIKNAVFSNPPLFCLNWCLECGTKNCGARQPCPLQCLNWWWSVLGEATNCVTYVYQTKENEETTVLIQSKYEENIRFILTLEEVHEFFLGFRNLCFKLFCYPIKIEEQIFRIPHSESFTYLKNINKEDNISMQCSNEFTKNEMVLLQQVLLRHHTLLLKIKCSLDNFSDEVTL